MSSRDPERRRAWLVITLAQLAVTLGMLAGVVFLPGPAFVRFPFAFAASFLLSGPTTRLALRLARLG
jgi:hypothetical protein